MIKQTVDTQPRAEILVVDDVPVNLTLLNDLLRGQGYKVYAALNGKLALRALQHLRPELILLDIRMPDMDGYQVCNMIRQNPQLDEIPIIFISALDDADDKVKAYSAGGVDYIGKPFQEAEVLARVDAWVDLIHKRRALARSQQQLDERTRAFQGVVSWLAGDLMQAGFGEHPQRVARLVAELAERTGCSADRVTALRLAASLLDIGMREMPADALRRDGPLSEDERRLLRQHPQWVGDRLQELQLPWPLAEWVVQHHERIDGSGYPRGLADQEISPEAGLLGLADLVCAMLAERPYRPGLERQQVIAWLGGPGRAQFPAGPLDACLEVLRDEVLLTALALSGQSPEPSG